MATITIHLSKRNGELLIKNQLKQLAMIRTISNPYGGLSESKIAKRILERYIPKEVQKYNQKKK